MPDRLAIQTVAGGAINGPVWSRWSLIGLAVQSFAISSPTNLEEKSTLHSTPTDSGADWTSPWSG
jgi:hypothetical protein